MRHVMTERQGRSPVSVTLCALLAGLGGVVAVPERAAAETGVAYLQARDRFFDGPVEANAERTVLDVDVTVSDVGIVVARAFIDENSATNEIIGDDRSWSFAPTASARAHLAWDTGRGQVSVLMQESCVETLGIIACAPARPIRIVPDADAVRDFEGDPVNYVTVQPGPGAGRLSFAAALLNSITVGAPPRINARGVLAPDDVFRDPANGTRGPGVVSLIADRYPSWEFRRYPRLIEAGSPDRLSMGDRAAGAFLDLAGAPRVQCGSHGVWEPPYLNLVSCADEPPSTGLPEPTSFDDPSGDVQKYPSPWPPPNSFFPKADITEIRIGYRDHITFSLRTFEPVDPTRWDEHPSRYFPGDGGIAWSVNTDADVPYEYNIHVEYLDGRLVSEVHGPHDNPGEPWPRCRPSFRFDGTFSHIDVEPWCLGYPTAVTAHVRFTVTEGRYPAQVAYIDQTDWSGTVGHPRT